MVLKQKIALTLGDDNNDKNRTVADSRGCIMCHNRV